MSRAGRGQARTSRSQQLPRVLGPRHTLTAGQFPWAQQRGSHWAPSCPGLLYPHWFVPFCSQPPRPFEPSALPVGRMSQSLRGRCGEANRPREKLSPSEVSRDTQHSHTSTRPGPGWGLQGNRAICSAPRGTSPTPEPLFLSLPQGRAWCLGDSLDHQRTFWNQIFHRKGKSWKSN